MHLQAYDGRAPRRRWHEKTKHEDKEKVKNIKREKFNLN